MQNALVSTRIISNALINGNVAIGVAGRSASPAVPDWDLRCLADQALRLRGSTTRFAWGGRGAEAELPFCRPLYCQLPFLKEFGAYSSNMAFDPLSLAYHEAGHAIVARHFGCELIDIFISLDDQCGGATVTACGLNQWQKGLIALASCAAEVLAGHAVAEDPSRAWE